MRRNSYRVNPTGFSIRRSGLDWIIADANNRAVPGKRFSSQSAAEAELSKLNVGAQSPAAAAPTSPAPRRSPPSTTPPRSALMAVMKKALEKYYKFVYRHSVDDSMETDYDNLSIEVMVYRLTSDGADTPFHIIYMELDLDALGYTKLFMLTDYQGSVLSAADLDQLYRRGESDPVPTHFPAHDLTGLDRWGRHYARLRELNEPIYFNQAMEQLVRAYGNGVKLSLPADAEKEFSNEAMQQVAKWAFTGGEFFNRAR